MSKTPRPSGPKIDLTSGVPDEPDTAPEIITPADVGEMTLGELLNLSVPSDDPQMQGMITDDPVPASQITDAPVAAQPGYSDMINSLAGAHGSFSGAINDLAKTGTAPDPAAIGKAVSPPADPQPPSHPAPTAAPKAKSKSTPKNIQGGATAAPQAQPQAKSSADIKFVSRIRITEAYQYLPQTLNSAPIWVDRNWVGYAGSYDSVRGLDPGPCLRVPDPGKDDQVIVARAGDYVVMQDVQVDGGGSIIEIEVWEKDQFERLFMEVMGDKA